MKVLLLRHGIAEDIGPGGRDADRALTPAGVEQLRSVAAALVDAEVRCDALRASPLRRAVETARLVAPAVGHRGEVETCDELIPDAPPEETLALLAALRRAAVVMLVGHEPHLGNLAALLVGARPGAVHFKKAGLVRIDIEGRPGAGSGELRWLLTPTWMLRPQDR
jgi:phosphohistidine phosphatase